MKNLYAAVLLILSISLARADGPSLKEARQRWLHGNYQEARTLYEALAREDQQKPSASIGLSRTLQSQGEYDRALEVLDAALAQHLDSAELHARRAELLYLRGRWADAGQAADKALALKPGQFLARWIRGQVARDRADFKLADSEFRWFVRTYTERSDKEDDIKDPEELLLVGLAGTENARWHNLSDQFRIILNDVYGDALKNEKDFWPAEFQAGMLLLEKYNRGEALDAFDKALAINPNAAEALVGKGIAALQKYEVKDAERFAERALQINPNLPEALRLRADISFMVGDLDAATRLLDHARTINPRQESTLGRSACCLYLRRDSRGFEQLEQEVERQDPKPGVFYDELAERLEERRQFDAAERYYKKALDLRPELPGPRNSLGLLYMRLGREKEALDMLTKAFKADEFNVRVANSLKVLQHLEKYDTLRTEHFQLRYDPQTDRRLARYMAPYLEDIYAQLAERFGYRLPGPILIEVFDSHEMFSGRTIALPDLHTVGACTGRVIAMASPYGKGIRRPFNWARVLRHELVHIFNLEQTRFQVPHWLTEGLAVTNEGFPRPQLWNQLLRERVATNDLMDLDKIDLGFIRPQSPLDWQMAYCQGQLYVEYLTTKYGPTAVSQLLSAYRDGRNTASAISQVCHVDKKSFEDGYRAFLEETVSEMASGPITKRMTYSQLQRAHEAEPDNLDVAARLAEQYLIRQDRKEARKLADAVLAKKAAHPLASYVKARLLQDAGEDEAVRTLLEAALDRQTPEPKVLQSLGKLYFEARDFTKAADIYELAHRKEPYESKWMIELVRVYAQAGDKAKQISMLEKLVATDADDLDQRKRLAKMLLDAGRHREAERYAREALEIDVRDAEAREFLQQALLGQNKSSEWEKLHQILDF
ncbi:MAG TPA: tetratricopeptide repeat protein [Gemmataceae bacterium]|nr:tetratricopeptide repeat protein [Gemmataceae bacterium]